MKKSGFSLIELLVSLLVISAVTAAFAPSITKRLEGKKTASKQPMVVNLQLEGSKKEGADLENFIDTLKNCRVNSKRTKLICEIEISQTDAKNSLKNPQGGTSVKYSERRDKIRFKTAKDNDYQTTTAIINPNLPQNPQGEYEEDTPQTQMVEIKIPIEDNKFNLDNY